MVSHGRSLGDQQTAIRRSTCLPAARIGTGLSIQEDEDLRRRTVAQGHVARAVRATLQGDARADGVSRVRHTASLGRVGDDMESRRRAGVEIGVDEHVAHRGGGPVHVDDAQRLLVVEYARPGEDLAAAAHREARRRGRSGAGTDARGAARESRSRARQRRTRRYVASALEAVPAGGAERAEAGQVVVERPPARPARPSARRGAPGRTSPRAGSASCPPQPGSHCRSDSSGPAKRLLGAVVDAGNAEREQLDRDAGDDLVSAAPLRREAQLRAEDVVVVVEDRDVRLPSTAVRAEPGRAPDRSRAKYSVGRGSPLATAVSAGRASPMSSAALRFRSSTSR